MMGATIKSVVYGLESQGDDDKYIKLADEVIRRGAKATVPGAFLVDIIPARASVSATPLMGAPCILKIMYSAICA